MIHQFLNNLKFAIYNSFFFAIYDYNPFYIVFLLLIFLLLLFITYIINSIIFLLSFFVVVIISDVITVASIVTITIPNIFT